MDDIQRLRAQCLMQALTMEPNVKYAVEIAEKMVDYILSGKTDEKPS